MWGRDKEVKVTATLRLVYSKFLSSKGLKRENRKSENL